MISSNCSIKLLDNVHIGCRVRMTSDKSTLPFKNEPMKCMKIVKYNDQGFLLSHRNLPKPVWVDFCQLPLTNLTIINGVIQDEITFVENINQHRMELIKTDFLDYIELLDIKSREKTKEYHTVHSIGLGDVVKSALCNGGKEMIFLGNFYTKEINIKYNHSYYNSHSDNEYYLSKNSPRKSIFLVSSKELSSKEKMKLAEWHDYYDDDWNGIGNERIRTNESNYKKGVQKTLDDFPDDRFEIVDYPITSKVIKNLVKVGTNDSRFSDKDKNLKLIMNGLNSPIRYRVYRRLKDSSNICQGLKDFIPYDDDAFDNVKITNKCYGTDCVYASHEKSKNYDEEALNFVNENFVFKVKLKK